MHLSLRTAQICNPDNVGSITWPVLVLGASTAAWVSASPTHALLDGSIAAGSVALVLAYRQGFAPSIRDLPKSHGAIATGVLLAISSLAQRAASSSLWWSLILLPPTLSAISKVRGPLQSTLPSPIDGTSSASETGRLSWRHLVLLLLCAVAIVQNSVIDLSSLTKAILNILSTAGSLVLLESLVQNADTIALLDEKHSVHNRDGENSSSKIFLQASLVAAVLQGIASSTFEPQTNYAALLSIMQPKRFVAIASTALALGAAMRTTKGYGSLQVSILLSMAAVAATTLQHFSVASMLFASLTVMVMALESTPVISHLKLKPTQIARTRNAAIFIIGFGLLLLGIKSFMDYRVSSIRSFAATANIAMQASEGRSGDQDTYSGHPIESLVQRAGSSYETIRRGQSSSLSEAVATYKRRYGLAPPPHFDKWYEFARNYDLEMIDEFDTIHENLLPFWAISPRTLRTRVTEALGYERNGLISLIIRNGEVVATEGGQGWQQESLRGLVAKFVHMLPDLDLAFNMHDEPRIVVPHDELSRMVAHAQRVALPSALAHTSPHNAFSARPSDMTEGHVIPEAKTSRFNEYAHQNTWIPSRLSCPPDSPARDFSHDDTSPEQLFSADDTAPSMMGSLGFIHNQTAATDICSFPSLKSTHGFFDRPNAFKVAHELIPIFSESKVSSFQDILFPSMWHWNRRLPAGHNRTEDMHLPNLAQPMYDPSADTLTWKDKAKSLYWRGSTTGGYSVHGAWRNHHRQRLVRMVHAQDRTRVLAQTVANDTRVYAPQTVARSSVAHLFNVSFAGVGQCSPADCHAQEEFFALAPYAPPATAWQFRHLLDMDGNAFSARFYALLASGALVHKMAVFREWHDDWLRPWVHYAPLSLRGDEWAEQMRFVTQEGDAVAQGLAQRGREWVQTLGRREVLEVWMFRLLLEYARVVDDAREEIGYAG